MYESTTEYLTVLLTCLSIGAGLGYQKEFTLKGFVMYSSVKGMCIFQLFNLLKILTLGLT